MLSRFLSSNAGILFPPSVRARSIVFAAAPRISKHPLRHRGPAVQLRHYNEDIVYGHRLPAKVEIPDYTADELKNQQRNAQLVQLVNAYRDYAHRASDLDPLCIKQANSMLRELDPGRYGLDDPARVFDTTGIVSMPANQATLAEIIGHLNRIYAGRIAYEFMHLPEPGARKWFAEIVESAAGSAFQIDNAKRCRMQGLLTRSEVFDHFMQKKFGHVKRYGLEGAESMLVALDQLLESGSRASIAEAVLCMAHRGRLNLLADLLQYPLPALFSKLQGNSELPPGVPGSGDVLSHLANSPFLHYGEGEAARSIHVSMLENPSHLEAVNPVALGNARARQMYLYDVNTDPACTLGDRVMSIQIHGDAAFTGQGIVMETLGLSNLPHFSSGGTIHVIVNNQLGYTTPAENARSTLYTSDIGKMVDAPIIHVNGDHPEEVAKAAHIAFAYRAKFRRDVIIDLVTFRRWGHNELDEPSFTQPKMYEIIRTRKSVPKLYEEELARRGVVSPEQIDRFRDEHFNSLSAQLSHCLQQDPAIVPSSTSSSSSSSSGGAQNNSSDSSVRDVFKSKWANMSIPTRQITRMDTGVNIDVLREVGRQSVAVPDGFKVHQRLEKLHIRPRLKNLESGTNIDWATAESLALATLLKEGYHVRISGQDVGRGTFSQRHVMMVCQETENVYIPLNDLASADAAAAATMPGETQAGRLEVANSHLSELAVLGFEYGASWANPNLLPIWESQFGDFNNSAQVIIDTYVVSGETKWLRQSGLVMLLPHGYDGSGPEHSSCRIERFLQLCDDPYYVTDPNVVFNTNIHVAYPTTPAQIFHLLRRQMLRPYRKPLIVAGPKTLLRLSAAVSTLDDMKPGTSFEPVLADPQITDPSKVRRVVFLSGKLYYDLAKARSNLKGTATSTEEACESVALIRIEELSPFPKQEILNVLGQFEHCEDFVWCQEETQNAGAFTHMAPRIQQLLDLLQFPGARRVLRYIGRGPLAAPVTGIGKQYKQEQQGIINKVFEGFN